MLRHQEGGALFQGAGHKFQAVDLTRFGMSKGELASVKAAVGGLEAWWIPRLRTPP